MASLNCRDCVVSFIVTCWLFITLLPTCFLLSTSPFPFQLCIIWNSYLICKRVQCLCNFDFLMWLLLQMPCPLIRPFIFRVLVCHYQLVDPCLVLCLGLILPCRSFRQLPWYCIEWLSTYLVRWLPCTWMTVLQMLICVIKVVQCLLFYPDWPARYWVWLTGTVLLLFQHTFLPSPCGGQLSVMGLLLPEWHLLPQMAQAAFAFGAYQRRICCHPPIPLNASIITPWKHHYLCGPWGWTSSAILWRLFPSPSLVSLGVSKFLVDHVEGWLRLLILVEPCWMEAPWIPTVLNI